MSAESHTAYNALHQRELSLSHLVFCNATPLTCQRTSCLHISCHVFIFSSWSYGSRHTGALVICVLQIIFHVAVTVTEFAQLSSCDLSMELQSHDNKWLYMGGDGHP